MKTKQLTIINYGLFILVISLLFSCSEQNQTETGSGSIYVLNEGLFNSGTAEITRYNPETGETTQSVFSAVNNGAVIGDILHSAKLIDNELFFVVNNSRKIIVTDPTTLVLKRTLILPSNASPRYIEVGNKDELIVTDLYSTYLRFLDKSSGKVLDSLNIRSNSEGLVRSGDHVFITNPGQWPTYTDSITVLNLVSKQFQKVKLDGVNFTEVRIDEANRVWIVASGNYDTISGKLFILNGDDASVIQSIQLGGSPSDFAFNKNRNEVLVLNSNTVQVIDYQLFTIKSEKQLSGNLYALNVDEKDQKVYITDARNYTSDGFLNVFSSTLDSLNQVSTGVNPGFIYIPN